MPDTRNTGVESSDAELIAAVRAGDTESYGVLFDRHRDAASRLSRQLVRGPDADDLVAESFARVLTVLQAGKGPDESFRAYLLTSIRRLHIDKIRHEKRVRSTDDETELDRAVEFVDPAEMKFEQAAAASAYASLPERWQLVLWHLDVEGQKPADIAPLLGMSANSVSALAYRAREGLRQAYLQSHLSPSLHASCRTTTGMLGSYVRKGLSARDNARVEAHLDECARCTGLYLELSEINSNLSGVLGPALLGPAAGGYLAGGGAAALVGVGAAVGTKSAMAVALETALVPIKIAGTAVVGAGTQGVVAAAVVVTVAAAGTVAVTTDLGSTAKDRPEASAPATTAPAPAPSPSTEEPTEPAPIETTVPTPVPTEVASTIPVVPEVIEPTAEPSPEPVEPAASTEAEPIPTPVPEPIVPTDYAITSVQVVNDLTLLQRRFTIGIGATNAGRAEAEPVTLSMAFRRPVVFRSVVSPGWSCGPAARNRRLSTLTCTQTVAAGEGTNFVAKVIGLRPTGTVTVTAPGDPVAGNNSAPFSSGLWPIS